ncbi:MAG: YybH family protein [Steroidobacteraceae bacterium]
MHSHSQRRFLWALTTFMLAGVTTITRTAEPTALQSTASVIGTASPFIERANREWEVAIQTGDADTLSRPYREDGVFIGPDGTPVRGRAAIRAMYAARAAAKRRIVAAAIQSEGRIAAGPDDVYEWGSGWVFVQSAEGARSKAGGRYLTVWHRQPDGVWVITRNLAL